MPRGAHSPLESLSQGWEGMICSFPLPWPLQLHMAQDPRSGLVRALAALPWF